MSSVIRAVGEKLVRAKEWVGGVIDRNPTAVKVGKAALVILAIVGAFAAIVLTLGWGFVAPLGIFMGFAAVLIGESNSNQYQPEIAP
jgi:hypothetical protein